MAMEGRQALVSEDFEVPKVFVNEKFILRMLTIHDLVKDYDAVMSSTKHLRKTIVPFRVQIGLTV
jgi:hypothetical protein